MAVWGPAGSRIQVHFSEVCLLSLRFSRATGLGKRAFCSQVGIAGWLVMSIYANSHTFLIVEIQQPSSLGFEDFDP